MGAGYDTVQIGKTDMKLKTPEELIAKALAGIYGAPATLSADEVLIRAREAMIEAFEWQDAFAAEARKGGDDDMNTIQAIRAYERDRAKPLAEVAPHTVEDPDERAAYDIYTAGGGVLPWEAREHSHVYRSIIAGIKRGRELERGA